MKNFTTLLFLMLSLSLWAQMPKIYWQQDFDSTQWKTSVTDSNLCIPQNLPEGWSVYDSLESDFLWHWSLNGPRGYFSSNTLGNSFIPNNELIPDFPTKGNGFLLFEADMFNTKANGQSVDIYKNMNSYIEFGPIDLSSAESPIIELFLGYYLCCQKETNHLSLEISSDYQPQNPNSANWETYSLLEENQMTLQFQKLEIGLKNQVLSDSAYLRFYFDGYSHYFCAIDDITIKEAYKNDMIVLDNWIEYIEPIEPDNTWTDWEKSYMIYGNYTKIPEIVTGGFKQLRAAVQNHGQNDQQVQINLTIDKDGNSDYTATSTVKEIKSGAIDTLQLATNYSPPGKGYYQISATVITENGDENPVDNSFGYSFEITDYQYSRVYHAHENQFTAGGPLDFTFGGNDGDIIAQQFDMQNASGNISVQGVSFYFPSYRQESRLAELAAIRAGVYSVTAKLFKADKQNPAKPIYPGFISSETLILSLSDTSTWVNLPFIDEGNLLLEPGIYFAGIECFTEPTSHTDPLHFEVGVDPTAPKQMLEGGLLYFPPEGTWVYGRKNYAIDLLLKKPDLISSNELKSLRIYPNPFNGFITFTNPEDVVEYTIYSSDGRIIKHENPIQAKTINTGYFDRGIYLISIKEKSGRVITKKIIKE